MGVDCQNTREKCKVLEGAFSIIYSDYSTFCLNFFSTQPLKANLFLIVLLLAYSNVLDITFSSNNTLDDTNGVLVNALKLL